MPSDSDTWPLHRRSAAQVSEKQLRRACLVFSLVLVALVVLLVAMADGAKPRASALDVSQFGYPTSIHDPVLTDAPALRNGSIAFAYDAMAGAPAWTMALVTPESLAGGGSRGEFFSDDRVPREWRVTPGDFTGSGGDRGHYEPVGDFGTQAERDATFAMTNIGWQDSDLNQNFWARQIEEVGVRGPVREEGLVAVPVNKLLYPQPENGKLVIDVIGPRHVWKPDRWAKAVLFVDRQGKAVRMRAWIVPNRPIPDTAREADYRVSVDEFEREARLDVYWKLDDALEDRMEASR